MFGWEISHLSKLSCSRKTITALVHFPLLRVVKSRHLLTISRTMSLISSTAGEHGRKSHTHMCITRKPFCILIVIPLIIVRNGKLFEGHLPPHCGAHRPTDKHLQFPLNTRNTYIWRVAAGTKYLSFNWKSSHGIIFNICTFLRRASADWHGRRDWWRPGHHSGRSASSKSQDHRPYHCLRFSV